MYDIGAFEPEPSAMVAGRAPVVFGLIERDARLSPGSEALLARVSREALDLCSARAAMLRGEIRLSPAIDRRGASVVIGYAPGVSGCIVFLASFRLAGEEVRAAARAMGAGRLAARVCAALVEEGSLSRAAGALGLALSTARSEVRDAMRAIGVSGQSALVARLLEARLASPVESERTAARLCEVFGLRPREARIAALRASGLNRPAVCERLSISQWSVQEASKTIYETLAVAKAADLSRLVCDVMLATDLAGAWRR